MMKSSKRLCIFLLAVFVSQTAIAQGYEKDQPINGDNPFDGVWVDHGYVVLIKVLGDYARMQGKDIHSTWWARCSVDGQKLICKGELETDRGSELPFESVMTLSDGILRDEYRIEFAGVLDEGVGNLQKIKLVVPGG